MIEPRIVPPEEARAMAREASLPLRARSHADDDEAIRDLAHTAAVLGEQRKAVLELLAGYNDDPDAGYRLHRDLCELLGAE